MFPAALLNKLYLAKSLKNNEGGFEFRLKNNIDSGTLSAIRKLALDGVEIPLANVKVATSSGERPELEIGPRSPLPLYYSAECALLIAGTQLTPGKHKIQLGLSVFEAGSLEITLEDEV